LTLRSVTLPPPPVAPPPSMTSVATTLTAVYSFSDKALNSKKKLIHPQTRTRNQKYATFKKY